MVIPYSWFLVNGISVFSGVDLAIKKRLESENFANAIMPAPWLCSPLSQIHKEFRYTRGADLSAAILFRPSGA